MGAWSESGETLSAVLGPETSAWETEGFVLRRRAQVA